MKIKNLDFISDMSFKVLNLERLTKKNNLFLKIFFILILSMGNLNISMKSEVVNNSNNLSTDYFKFNQDEDYILGEGDQIFITLTEDIPEFSNIYSIDVNGTILLPLIKRIYISGLTLSELTKLLNEKYKEYVFYPDIKITVSKYRPINVYIKGEVNMPGLYRLQGAYYPNNEVINQEERLEDRLEINIEQSGIGRLNKMDKNKSKQTSNFKYKSKFSNGLGFGATNQVSYFTTLFDAIRQAGGITNYSDLSNIEVKRINNISNGGGYKKTELDFLDLITNGNENQNIRLKDGDVVTVNKSNNPLNEQISKAIKTNLQPKDIQIILAGRIKNPGPFIVPKTATLNDAIIASGGLKAIRGKVIFLRYNNDGTIDRRKFAYRSKSERGSYKNPFLNDGDIISIDENPVSIANQVLNDITRPMLGIFATYKIFD